MISFKQFLIEARMAPLFHATKDIFGIIKSNTLIRGNPRREHTHSKDGRITSLSRDFNFVRRWNADVIIEFNQQKLASRYKLIPFNYLGSKTRYFPTSDDKTFDFSNQSEESLVQDVKDVMKYITAIYVSNEAIGDKIRAALPDKYKDIPIKRYQRKSILD